MMWKDGTSLPFISIRYGESKYYYKTDAHPIPAVGGDIYKAMSRLSFELGEPIELGWTDDESWLIDNGYEKI